MSDIIKTKEFRVAFNKNSFLYRNILQNKLYSLATRDFMSNKVIALHKFIYFKSINNKCDIDIKLVLEHYIENGHSYIYDIDKLEFGEFEWVKMDFIKYVKGSVIEKKSENEIIDILLQKYNSELIHLEEEYWRDNKLIELANNTSFFEQRDPISIRERILSSFVVFVNGEQIIMDQTFYNKKGIIKLYENLIKLFFTEFELNKKLSNKKVKRYSKKINDDYSLSLYVNFGPIESNLASQNLTLPDFAVELHSNDFSRFLKPNIYLSNHNEYPIILINPYTFLVSGSMLIKKEQMKEDEFIKKAIMYFDFYSQVFKVHLDFIEMLVNKTLSECTTKSPSTA